MMLLLKIYATVCAVSMIAAMLLMILNIMEIIDDDSFLGSFKLIMCLWIGPPVTAIIGLTLLGLYLIWMN